jgi:nucleoside recognition membrane protein YjiH
MLLSGFQEAAGYSDAMVSTFTEKFGPLLLGEDIANSIHFMISQPPHVHISEIMVANTSGLSLIISNKSASYYRQTRSKHGK